MAELEGVGEWVSLSEEHASGLVWTRPGKGIRVGRTAFGTSRPDGYLKGCYKGKYFYAHQVVFYLVHGYVPAEIDHIDGNKSNNQPSNLRAATRSENQQNRRSTKGYCWATGAKKYFASIEVDGKTINLGMYNTAEAARAAYLHAKRVYHPSVPEDYYNERRECPLGAKV